MNRRTALQAVTAATLGSRIAGSRTHPVTPQLHPELNQLDLQSDVKGLLRAMLTLPDGVYCWKEREEAQGIFDLISWDTIRPSDWIIRAYVYDSVDIVIGMACSAPDLASSDRQVLFDHQTVLCQLAPEDLTRSPRTIPRY